MNELIAEYILIVLNTFTFILLAYHLLQYVSKRMKFKEKRPITAFRVAIVAGAFDLLLTLQYNLIMPQRTLLFIPILLLELIGFYLLALNIYNTKWRHSLSLAFFLMSLLFIAQIAVLFSVYAFLFFYSFF